MKINIELNDLELNEAGVVLAALNALKQHETSVSTGCESSETALTGSCESSKTSVSTEYDSSETDVDGLIWDARIHSSNHKKTADGRWQRRRNIPDELYESVKKELSGETVETPEPVAMPTVQEEIVDAQPEVAVIPAVSIEPVAMPTIPTVQVSEPVVEQPVAVETPALDANTLYMEMFAKLQAGFKNKQIDANYIQNTLTTLNTMFGKNWTGLAEIKEDVNALNVVIEQLRQAGL